VSEFLTPVVYQLGVGGILGFVVGYAFKKLTKLLAILAGIFAALLIYLANQGIISVNYGKLAELLKSMLGLAGQASDWIATLLVNMPFAGSFIVGAAIGLKAG